MNIPPEHAEYLRKVDFPVPDIADLTLEERGLLTKLGYWLEALAIGSIRPITDAQRQFVCVARGKSMPHASHEIAWSKYRRSLNPSRLLEKLVAAHHATVTVREELNARREAVIDRIRNQLDALEEEFAPSVAAAAEEEAKIGAELRKAVLVHGESVQLSTARATYVRGGFAWDTKGLNRYAETHTDLLLFRRDRPPTVQLRLPPPASDVGK